jgi:hypothetical protein
VRISQCFREVGPLIKIRYSELRAGLHVQVETRGPSTIIYLLPGLTLGQRRAALLRARRSASMGYGPRLSAAGLAAAVVRDRVGVTLRNGTAAFRAHPILLLPMAVVLGASMIYIMSTAVTITMHSPQDGGSLPGVTSGHHQPRSQPAYPVGLRDRVAPSPSVSSPKPSRPVTSGRPTRSPRPSRSPGPHSSSPAPTSSAPSPSRSSSPGPGPSSSPPASPSPSPSSSGTCLNVGPLGICLHL